LAEKRLFTRFAVTCRAHPHARKSEVRQARVCTLQAIGKYVLERSPEVRQGPRQVLAEDGSRGPSRDRDRSPVRGRLKWFDPKKGYGFVELTNGSGEAFLPATVLEQADVSGVRHGEILLVRVAPSQRGPRVTEVVSADSSTAVPSLAQTNDVSFSEASVEETGTVKSYSAAKGFGFIVPDGGGGDIFLHASALQRSGITSLNAGQRVAVGIVEGRKGPEAGSIREMPG